MRDPKDVQILVVDDEEALRKAIAFDFRRKGFRVAEAENGRSAFEIVKSNPIDVVLTDVRMPGGDGVELLDNIKALNVDLPVVMFITGFADITLEEAYDRGVDAVFAKPFDRKALIAAVLRAINRKEEQWRPRQSERVETDLSIEFVLSETQSIDRGKILNFGRGGFFIAMEDNFPAIDTKIRFNIKVNHGAVTDLEGSGIVRWIRAKEDNGCPAGCGVEFDSLSDASRTQIVSLLNGLKTKPFIPRK